MASGSERTALRPYWAPRPTLVDAREPDKRAGTVEGRPSHRLAGILGSRLDALGKKAGGSPSLRHWLPPQPLIIRDRKKEDNLKRKEEQLLFAKRLKGTA